MAQPAALTAATRSPRRTLTRRSPVPAALAVLTTSCIGAAIAIADGLPYNYGGHGDPNDVWGDFVHGGGTALSPPLPTLLILAVFTYLTTRQGRPAVIGHVALTIAAAAFTIAILGEPLTRRVLSPEHFEPLKAALTSAGLLASIAMGALAIRGLAGAHRDRATPFS